MKLILATLSQSCAPLILVPRSFSAVGFPPPAVGFEACARPASSPGEGAL